jgi:DDE family transposase
MFYVPAVSGMLFQEVLELQVQYMIDSKNGGRLAYSNVCGLTVYLHMIKKRELIGNGKLWMVLLQRRLLGEKCTGANPTDRAKCGTKQSMVVDGKGVPLGISVDAANRHDIKMTKTTLQSIVVDRPEPTTRAKQHVHVYG